MSVMNDIKVENIMGSLSKLVDDIVRVMPASQIGSACDTAHLPSGLPVCVVRGG